MLFSRRFALGPGLVAAVAAGALAPLPTLGSSLSDGPADHVSFVVMGKTTNHRESS